MMKRNVLITGASSGIGKAIAYAFAENGDNLVITGRRFDKLEEIKHDIEKQFHVQVSIYSFDITNMEQTIINCQKIIEEVGQIHILVNNAGLALGLDKFQDYDLTDMMTMIDTNIKGLLTVTRQLLPQMVENNEGHIINIGSTAGIYAYAGAAVYAATKSAVKVLSDGIRIDTIDKNIKVTPYNQVLLRLTLAKFVFMEIRREQRQFIKGLMLCKLAILHNVLFSLQINLHTFRFLI